MRKYGTLIIKLNLCTLNVHICEYVFERELRKEDGIMSMTAQL